MPAASILFLLAVQTISACFTDALIKAEPSRARLKLSLNIDKSLDLRCKALPSTAHIEIAANGTTFRATYGPNFDADGPKEVTLPCPDMSLATTTCIPGLLTLNSAKLTIKNNNPSSVFSYASVVSVIIADRFNYSACWNEISLYQNVYEKDGALDIKMVPLYCDIPSTASASLVLSVSDVETVQFELKSEKTAMKASDGVVQTTGYDHSKSHLYSINCSEMDSTSSSSGDSGALSRSECTKKLHQFMEYPYRTAVIVAKFSFTNNSVSGNTTAVQTISRVVDNSTVNCFTGTRLRIYFDKIYLKFEGPETMPPECAFSGDVKSIYLYFSLSDNVQQDEAILKCYYTRPEPDFTFNFTLRSTYWFVCPDELCRKRFKTIMVKRDTAIIKYGVYMTNLAEAEIKRVPFTLYPINVTCFNDIYANVYSESVCVHTAMSETDDPCAIRNLLVTTQFNLRLYYSAKGGIDAGDEQLAGAFTYIGKYNGTMCFSCDGEWIPNDKYYNGKYCGTQLAFLKSQYKGNHFYMLLEFGDVVAVPNTIYFLDSNGVVVTSVVLALIAIGAAVVILALDFVRVCRQKRYV